MPDRAMTINTPTLACCGQQRGECSCGGHAPASSATVDLLPLPPPLVANVHLYADPDEPLLPPEPAVAISAQQLPSRGRSGQLILNTRLSEAERRTDLLVPPTL